MERAPYLRCSDADRDQAAEVLRESMVEGRVTVAELDERLGRVYGAQTYADLSAVMDDLPGWTRVARPLAAPGYPVGPVAFPAAPAPAWGARRRLRPWLLAVVLAWLVWGAAVRTGLPDLAVFGQVPVLIVAVWGFVLLSHHRRHRAGRGRRLPPAD